MKKFLISAMLVLGMCALLQAKAPQDGSFPVSYSGQRPVISDFVSAILSQEDIGESLGEMKLQWDLYRAGKPLPQGRSFLVDAKNGYLCYESTDREEDGTVYGNRIEFCYWNHADGRHKLVALNTVCYRNGTPFMGQFSGISFYLYDVNSRKMGVAYESDTGINIDYPQDTELIVQKLPRVGKTIEYHYRTPAGKFLAKYTWVGDKFIQTE